MSREIKFRAWVPKMESMIEDVTVYPNGLIGMSDDDFHNCFEDDSKYHYDDYSCCVVKKNESDNENSSEEKMFEPLMGEEWVWIEENDNELMQYTGLKDKNGVEIHEDDIVKFRTNNTNEVAKVYWVSRGWALFNPSKYMGYDGHGLYSCEVIGNIYENPKLIESLCI